MLIFPLSDVSDPPPTYTPAELLLVPEMLIFPLSDVSDPPYISTPTEERLLVPERLIFPPSELIVPNEIEIAALLMPYMPLLPVVVPVRLIFPPSELMEVPVPCILMPEPELP
jgi:hypothetical protein